MISSLLHLLFLSCILIPISSHADDTHRQAYIVYMGEHSGVKSAEEILEHHHSSLLSVKNNEEDARESLLYSYKNSVNGFAALLSREEAAKLTKMEEVVSVFPSEMRSLHTTRSWEFIAHVEGLHDWERTRMEYSKTKYGEDVIIGMLDSGIWPESKSFDDEGMSPIPKHWKGICQEGDAFNSSHCNRKIIGARYYLKGYEAYHGALNTSYAFRSPRDHDGHGTHTASTAAGRPVRSATALGGFAPGLASGGAPLARLAVYKVCWPIPGPNPNIENTCFDADMLAAIDDAIADGVDVLSVSIGAVGLPPPKYSADGIAIGALHATKRGVVVACSAGNSGPAAASASNLAPWMITVGASSIDRSFDSLVVLGDGKLIQGQTVTPYTLKKRLYPLVYAGDIVAPGTPTNISGQCLSNTLSSSKAKGKIVVCMRGVGMRAGKGMEVKRAGGAAMILGNAAANGNEISVDAHVLPATAVTADGAVEILGYINASRRPTAMITHARTVLNVKPSPVMAAFSSCGPNPIEPNILKPDITAPGLNILAAWSEASAPTKLDGDDRRVKYNLMSGTSMSCPHVSAAAAIIKSHHPQWSSAAIRSALMTTATVANTQGGPITNAAGEIAGPLEYGSGHFQPSRALDPGLVYDASYNDYLHFVCASIGDRMDPTFSCPLSPPSPSDLNYPSVAVSELNSTVTVRRTVTNVAQVNGSPAQYYVSVVPPAGVNVEIAPKTLTFKKTGQRKRFYIKLQRDGRVSGGSGAYVSGSYSWSDGTHVVRSPIVVSFA